MSISGIKHVHHEMHDTLPTSYNSCCLPWSWTLLLHRSIRQKCLHPWIHFHNAFWVSHSGILHLFLKYILLLCIHLPVSDYCIYLNIIKWNSLHPAKLLCRKEGISLSWCEYKASAISGSFPNCFILNSRALCEEDAWPKMTLFSAARYLWRAPDKIFFFFFKGCGSVKDSVGIYSQECDLTIINAKCLYT